MFFLNFLHFEVVIPVAITIIIFVASWIFQPALSYYHLLNQIRPTLTLTVKVEKSKSRSRKNNIIELETVEVPNPTITPYDIEYDLSIVIPAYNEVKVLLKYVNLTSKNQTHDINLSLLLSFQPTTFCRVSGCLPC